MGITSWYATILMALAVTVSGKLATLTGAWKNAQAPVPAGNAPVMAASVQEEVGAHEPQRGAFSTSGSAQNVW